MIEQQEDSLFLLLANKLYVPSYEMLEQQQDSLLIALANEFYVLVGQDT